MSNSTATLSFWSKLKAGLPKANHVFKDNCAAQTDNAKPAMNKRQDRVRAIWVNAMLWTFQGWLAMFYAGASFAKLTAPSKHLAILLGWAEHVPQQFIMAVGVIEATLAIGMLVPIFGWTIGKPVLTYSALGFLAIQTIVALYHLASFDILATILNLVLMAMTASILIFRCARNAP